MHAGIGAARSRGATGVGRRSGPYLPQIQRLGDRALAMTIQAAPGRGQRRRVLVFGTTAARAARPRPTRIQPGICC